MKIEYNEYKLHWTNNKIKIFGEPEIRYFMGSYHSKFGMADVYAQKGYVMIQVIVDGMMKSKFYHDYNKKITLRGLAILAGKFLREVHV